MNVQLNNFDWIYVILIMQFNLVNDTESSWTVTNERDKTLDWLYSQIHDNASIFVAAVIYHR